MVASGNAGEFTVPGNDGDFITAEDAANCSRVGEHHSSVLQKGAVDGAWQALLIAGRGSVLKLYLAVTLRKKQSTGT